MEPSAVFGAPAEIGYGGTVQPSGMGAVKITIQSRMGPKEIQMSMEQYQQIPQYNDEIESTIGALKHYQGEKREAEARAAAIEATEKAVEEAAKQPKKKNEKM